MAIQFKEIRKYIARNIRLSICFFKNGHYDDYLMLSDIPDDMYNDMCVYGIGKIDVEFSKDIYSEPSSEFMVKDIDICPALEIVLWDRPRDDVPVRKMEDVLKFEDLRNYLTILGHYSVVFRKDWSSQSFESRKDIPDTYNEYFVYGIGLEDDPDADEDFKNREYDNSYTKRMVIVLSDAPRFEKVKPEPLKTDFTEKSAYGKGPFFLLVTADEWCHDADEWLGIYVSKIEAKEAYDRAVEWWDEEQKQMPFTTQQRVAMFEYVKDEDKFREVDRKELN